MGYTKLPRLEKNNSREGELTLTEAVTRFIQERCEGLRFDASKEEQEKKENVLLGTSVSKGQIEYNMQMDIDRLCLENAVKRFLSSGAARDAFDVYFCFLEMFVGNYGHSREMIEMLSEFETNSGALLMKHRDHYSHSVYVFALGLALYETNKDIRKCYDSFYSFETDTKEAAHHFLEYWGLTALFHDIGYPFELPFEQVASYFEVQNHNRSNNPYLSYECMDRFIKLDEETKTILEKLYGKEFESTDDLFAYDITGKLGGDYRLDKNSFKVILKSKPVDPECFGHFMDHAYFSASILFRELRAMDGGKEFTKARVDALTAILLHNSLYKFSVAFYKNSEMNKPLTMSLHPLAYMLMVCDELQCWDRTSYGRNSRSVLYPMGCDATFGEGKLEVVYIFDEEEKDKIEDFEERYRRWSTGEIPDKPVLKEYSKMVHENDFLHDIERILDTEPLGLKIDIKTGKAVHKNKNEFLSHSNFIHLYNFAVSLNGRYSYGGDEDSFDINDKLESDFDGLSLEYKLSNIGQAKEFARYLNEINCFYTDRPVDFEMVTDFTQEEMDIIGRLEHMRWLKEHKEMGWRYGEEYVLEKNDLGEIVKQDKLMREQKRIHALMMDGEINEETAGKHYDALPESEKKKDYEPMRSLMKLIRKYDGLRIYRL